MKTNLTKDLIVTSVTVNWNGKDVLPKCIQSLKNMDIALYEIIVVDNNSTDDSVEIIKRDFPEVIILKNEQNLGAPRGRNVGLRRALQKPVDYILTLDNDLFIEKSCLKELLYFSEQELTIGTIGAFIYDASNPQHLLSAGGIVDYTQNISRQLLKYSYKEKLIDVDYCGTGAMLTRRRVFDELGLLDENFIGYGYEDTDFGLRVRKAGYRVCTCSTAKVWHAPHSNIGRYTFRKKYLESRNAILFMKKYATLQNWTKFSFYSIVGILHAFIFQGVVRRNMMGVWGKVKGLYDGFLGEKKLSLELLKSIPNKK